VQGATIKIVLDFKYLGRILSSNNGDEPTVNLNLKRGRSTCGRISRILSREGDSNIQSRRPISATLWLRAMGTVPFRDEQTAKLSRTLRPVRYFTGQYIRENADGSCICPLSASVLESAVLWPIQEYIPRRRASVLRLATSRNGRQQWTAIRSDRQPGLLLLLCVYW
jgi:hypothetical protein